MSFVSLILSSEVVNEIPGEPWWYGVGAGGGLILVLYIVTRFNPKR